MGVTIREKEKGSGVWWVFVNHNNRRRSKKVGDKKQAREIAKKLEAKLTLKDLRLDRDEKKAPLFKEYAQTFSEVVAPAVLKPSTVKNYESILKKHILPVFGNMPVDEIRKLEIKKFLMKQYAGRASSTITHFKNAISNVLNLAVDDEVLAVNPAHRLGRIVREKSLKIEIEPLTRDELKRLLNSFQENFPRYYALALTLARTGIRIGEAIALKWGDIDFNSRFINIQRGFSYGKIETPKNGKSRRVDMSLQLSETLQKHRHDMKVEAMSKGWGAISEWLFVAEKGNPLILQHWKPKIFDKALEKAGLRKIRIHDLRHTYASLLIQAGESLAYVRDQLGHHSIKVTVDIYGHLAPEGNKAAVDRLDDDGRGCTLSAPENEKALTGIG